jgi:hypothetical protein
MSRSFPSSRGSSTCPRFTVGGKINNNLEQRINSKFCVMIGNSASETSALLTSAYGEYTMKKSSVLNEIGGSKEGKKMCKRTQVVGSQKLKGEMQIWTEYDD